MNFVIRVIALPLLLLSGVSAYAESNTRHHDFPVAVTGFHDVMAPLWHAESGEERNQKICKQYPILTSRLNKIRSANVPENVDATQWRHAVENLYKVLLPIESLCVENRTPEYAMANVHYGFHALVKLIGYEH
ncbi:MAG: hypothetical protein COB77_04700 [Gammaproteobacteria bacterium]|nr:MAG: hypothetical protein COB77_04700 [Gammaproteobacteria bacterium]